MPSFIAQKVKNAHDDLTTRLITKDHKKDLENLCSIHSYLPGTKIFTRIGPKTNRYHNILLILKFLVVLLGLLINIENQSVQNIRLNLF